MTEPRTKANGVEAVAPGVWRWHVSDDRMDGFESDAYALVVEGRVVLVDPLPIDAEKLRALGEIDAIVITIQSHQRSAWRLRKELGVPVWAPAGSQGLEETPDHTFSGGDLLPGGLSAFHAPGPCDASYVLWGTTPEAVAFLGDLAMHDGTGRLRYPPAQYQDEPDRAQASVERLLRDVPAKVACFGHGPPLTKGVRQALEKLAASRPE